MVKFYHFEAPDFIIFLCRVVLGIRTRNRIFRICMFLDLPDPDPLVRGPAGSGSFPFLSIV
jgi:hypothetical protein